MVSAKFIRGRCRCLSGSKRTPFCFLLSASDSRAICACIASSKDFVIFIGMDDCRDTICGQD